MPLFPTESCHVWRMRCLEHGNHLVIMRETIVVGTPERLQRKRSRVLDIQMNCCNFSILELSPPILLFDIKIFLNLLSC